MENEQLHHGIDEKNYTLILSELDQKISEQENVEHYESMISMFESLDKDFREEHAQNYYFVMWKVALRSGKVKLAKSYAEFILNYLIEYKRVPALKKLIGEFLLEGLYKNHKKYLMIDFILGKKNEFSLEDSHLFESHPEMWKNSKNILKDYLLSETDWKIAQWKLAYEYVLKFYYDKDLFLLLAEKASSLNKENHKRNILNYLAKNKVDLKSFETKSSPEKSVKKDSTLNLDYDQLAMDVISGTMEPSITEQKKILISIDNLSDEELVEKGKDMVVAFGLLGMDKVVVRLCERVIPALTDVKSRASLKFMMAQALYNNNEFFKVIDLINDTFAEEPLLADEILAFNYLKAECLFKLKKYKLAKELFLKIKKQSPHYRLVGERLRHIEEIK